MWAIDVDPRSFARLDGDVEADVAVVGGGITGLTTAAMCSDAGLSVAVVEADRIASGTTAGTTGKVTSQHGLFYDTAIGELGEDAARIYADANQAAIGIVESLTERHEVDAYASRLPSYVFTRDASRVAELRAEVDAARRVGLPASFTADLDLPFDVAGAVRFDDQLQIHPTRFVHGLARAIDGGDTRVYEHSRVVDVSENGDTVTVRTQHGTVRARHAVIATLLPITDRGFEFAKTRPTRSYGIAVELETEPPEPMYISVEEPKRSLRHYRGEHGVYLVVVGEGHETGHGDDLTRHYEALAEFAREHFSVRSVAFRWSAQDYLPVDGVPYIGRLNFTDHVYVATGFKKWGLSNGVVAGRIITDAILGHHNPWSGVFDSQRSVPFGRYADLVKDNAHVARQFAAGRLSLPDRDAVEHLEPGQGVVIRHDGRPVAVCRHRNGELEAVGAVCTHLGCVVHWNDAETSWDCPCHGSRFATNGDVLAGPAVKPLGPAELA